MEAVIAILVGAASVAWWRRTRRPARNLEDYLAEDAQVVLHVAEHELESRHHATLTSFHVLYGLLQDETVANAIRTSGGQLEPVEERVLAALDDVADEQRTITVEANTLIRHAVTRAFEQQRSATAVDLWAYLLRSDAAALLADAKLDALAVLHVLIHAAPLPALAESTGDVHVVLRNDDFTPQDFVTHLLVRTFELPDADAEKAMMATHTEGKAVCARLPVGVANAKIREARELARSQHFPLWIAAEPA